MRTGMRADELYAKIEAEAAGEEEDEEEYGWEAQNRDHALGYQEHRQPAMLGAAEAAVGEAQYFKALYGIELNQMN